MTLRIPLISDAWNRLGQALQNDLEGMKNEARQLDAFSKQSDSLPAKLALKATGLAYAAATLPQRMTAPLAYGVVDFPAAVISDPVAAAQSIPASVHHNGSAMLSGGTDIYNGNISAGLVNFTDGFWGDLVMCAPLAKGMTSLGVFKKAIPVAETPLPRQLAADAFNIAARNPEFGAVRLPDWFARLLGRKNAPVVMEPKVAEIPAAQLPEVAQNPVRAVASLADAPVASLSSAAKVRGLFAEMAGTSEFGVFFNSRTSRIPGRAILLSSPEFVAMSKDGYYVHARAARSLLEMGADAIPGLIDMLKDPSAGARAFAARELGFLRSGDAVAAVPALIDVVKIDSNVTVRIFAINALTEIGSAESATPALMDVVRSSAPWKLKNEAFSALGKIGDESAVPMLTRRLFMRDPAYRKSADLALGEISRRKGLRIVDAKVLSEAVLHPDIDLNVFKRSVDYWRFVGADTVLQLTELTSHPDPIVRAKAFFALGETCVKGGEVAASKLLSLLADQDPVIRGHAVKTLGRLHSEARLYDSMDRASQLLTDPDVSVQIAAANAIKNLAPYMNGDPSSLMARGFALPGLRQIVREVSMDSPLYKAAEEAMAAIVSLKR